MTKLVAAELRDSDLSFVIDKATPVVLRAPIKTPVQTSFGTMTDRPALFLLLESSDGYSGIGEVWCNFPGCGAEHRAELINTAILPALIGVEFSDPEHCYYTLQKRFQTLAVQSGEPGPIAQSIAGVDIALWDLIGKRLNLPLYKVFGGDDRNRAGSIGVYASGINPYGATDTFLRCRDAGYTAFKLKIGFGDDIDFQNIESICSELEAGEQLMVDANQAWSVDEALVQVDKLADYPLEWLEEPIMADSPIDHWVAMAQASKVPLAAGENMLALQSFTDANTSEWLSVMQPDICKWGGFSAVLPVARQAMDNGKRYCPHFLGGGVGLAASAHLLAAVGGSGILEIDSNPNPLREGLFSPSIDNGQIVVSDKPGLGIDLGTLKGVQDKLTVAGNC